MLNGNIVGLLFNNPLHIQLTLLIGVAVICSAINKMQFGVRVVIQIVTIVDDRSVMVNHAVIDAIDDRRMCCAGTHPKKIINRFKKEYMYIFYLFILDLLVLYNLVYYILS